MQNYLIRDIRIVNEGTTTEGDVLIKNGRIEKVGGHLSVDFAVTEIAGSGKHLLPLVQRPGLR